MGELEVWVGFVVSVLSAISFVQSARHSTNPCDLLLPAAVIALGIYHIVEPLK